ncbi:UPF0056 inner membrane protein YchE [hydrothermal vent metagenome]|uniref:UPF0056 inner membrane protein YchE n=1 Tax=hydrothermal vent metagenome TaxID=652676 RepID=A0A3B0TMZ0_9ZZZZ
MLEFQEYLKIIVSLIVIINPLGNSPIFLSVTEGQKPKQRNKTARMTAVSVGIILILSLLFGGGILKIFGIDIPSFKVGSGILILIMSISMLHARVSESKHTTEEAQEAGEKDNVSVVPLGIPLLAGPGAISTVIVCAHHSATWGHKLILIGIVVVIAFIIWVVLRLASSIGDAIGTTGINIGTRLMGLILAAVAVEFISQGLIVLFPVLNG